MTESIYSQLLGFTTFNEVWKVLERLFSSQFEAKIQTNHTTIQTTQKGIQTLEEYLNKMKSIFNGLSMVGELFPMKDLISCVLVGLDSKYTPIMVQINAKYSISWQVIGNLIGL